jgi:trans-4-hydroxy-L-proline dehydratase
MGASYLQAAHPVELYPDFWKWSRVERRAWFVRDTIVNYVPQEILPGNLPAGARFNIQTSLRFTEDERRQWLREIKGKNGARAKMKWFHDHGYGNSGATIRNKQPSFLLTIAELHLMFCFHYLVDIQDRSPYTFYSKKSLSVAEMAI